MSYESVEQAALALADQALPSEQLPAIANQFPQLRPAVAAHRSAYPALLDWLDSLGDDAVRAAVARRRAVHAALSGLGTATQATRAGAEAETETVVSPPPGHAMRGEPAEDTQVVPQPEEPQPQVPQPEMPQPEMPQPEQPQPQVPPQVPPPMPPPQMPPPLVSPPQVPQQQMPQPQQWVPQTDAPQIQMQQPQMPQPEMPQPEMQQPQMLQPQVPRTQVPQTEVMQLQVPQPGVPQQWSPQPQVPQPQVPQPEVAQPGAQMAQQVSQPVAQMVPQPAVPSGVNQPPDDSKPAVGHPASSPARVIGGILIALAGVASLIASFVVYPALKISGFAALGGIPGLSSASSSGGVDVPQIIWQISAIVVAVVWIGLGVFMAIAPRRLTLTAILALISVTLFVFVPAIEMWFYLISAAHVPVVVYLGAVLELVAIVVALVLLIPATKAAAAGKPFTGLKVAVIVLLALALGYQTYSALTGAIQQAGPIEIPAAMTVMNLISRAMDLLWTTGLLLFAIAVKARRVDAPPSEVLPAAG